MIAYILKVTLCWLFFYGIYELFLRKRTFFTWNRSYLVLTLILGALLPLLQFIPWKNETNISYVIYPILSEIDQVQITVQEKKGAATVNWMTMLTFVYAVGVIVSLVRLMLGLGKIVKLYRESNKFPKGQFTLVRTDKIHLPFSFFRWVFLSNSLQLSKDMEKVLEHEIEHIKGRHSYDVLFMEFLKVFFWCSPLIYLYKKALREIHEFLADYTVSKKSDKKKYKALLLDHTVDGMQMALTHQFYNSHLKNRLKMINQKRSGRSSLVMYAFGIPVLFLLFFAFTKSINQNTSIEGDRDQIGMTIDIENTDSEQASFHGVDAVVLDGNRFEPPLEPFIKMGRAQKEKTQNSPHELIEKMGLYYNETDPSKVPYFQIEGKDIDLPLSKHLSLYESFGSVTTILPERAQELFGVKAKLGYIHFENPILKNESGNILNGAYGKDGAREFIHQTKDYYKNKSFEAKKINITSGSEILNNVLLARLADTIPTRNTKPLNTVSNFYQQVDQLPVFPGCNNLEGKAQQSCSNQKLIEFISSNLKYPEKARKNDIEGIVVVSFVVTKDGKIANEMIGKDIGGDLGYAALDVVRKMNTMPAKWIPGKKDGKAVNTQLSLPISFKLPPEKDDWDDETAKKVYQDIKQEKEVFKVVEEMPRFPGCEDILDVKEREQCSMKKMLEFIYTNVKYPAEAKQKGIEGMAVVQFVVMKDGSIEDIEIIRDLDGGCGESAKNAVQSMIDQGITWIPGKQRGKNVNVEFKLPVRFKLTGDSKSDNKDQSGNPEVIKENVLNLNDDLDVSKAYIQVNGKEWSKSLEDIDQEQILTVDVRSPEWSIPQFGEKAKHGAILITLKDETLKESTTIKLGANEGDPLYVLDGEILDVSLEEENLNPDDIAEINVVKGEAAIKQYGDQGQHGVIEIYTKKYRKKNPSPDKKVRIKRNRKGNKNDKEEETTVIKMVDVFIQADKALEGLDYIDVDNMTVNDKANSLKLKDFKVYPNPGNDFVKLQFKAEKLPTTVQIVDQSGKVIFSRTMNNFSGVFDEQITLQEHAGGPAFLRVIQDNKLFVDKLILK